MRWSIIAGLSFGHRGRIAKADVAMYQKKVI